MDAVELPLARTCSDCGYGRIEDREQRGFGFEAGFDSWVDMPDHLIVAQCPTCYECELSERELEVLNAGLARAFRIQRQERSLVAIRTLTKHSWTFDEIERVLALPAGYIRDVHRGLHVPSELERRFLCSLARMPSAIVAEYASASLAAEYVAEGLTKSGRVYR